ncbi:hypothetical protein [Owenweeksia hongkongensis]|uniref:hypothetical protein n=1 Tax=Owenweeksia hongkongensis TaxID=253245 RepID=UPI003A907A51
MTKTSLFMGLAMLCSSLSFGQYHEPKKIDFEISEPYKVVDAQSKSYFQLDDQVFSIKIDKKTAIIQRFDVKTMKETNRIELEMPKSYSLETIKKIGDEYYVFYSIYDKGRKSEQLFCRAVDFEAGKYNGSEKLLVTTRGKIAGASMGTQHLAGGMFSVMSFGVTDKFDFYQSADKSKLLVQYRMVPTVKNDSKSFDKIGLHVFDTDLKEIWGEVQRMPYTEKKMNIIDYAIDNDANAYIMSTVFDDNSTRTTKKGSKDEPNYHIEMLKRTTAGKRLEQSTPSLDDKFISSVWLYETSDDKMVIAGFYNNTDSRGDAEGIFYAKLKKDGTTYDQQTHAIPLEVLNQYESKRTRKKNTKKEDKGESEFYKLKLRKLQFMEDGSIVMIGEQNYVVQHTTTNSRGGSSTYYTYHYNDMLVSKIDPTGSLAWMTKLPKSQVGRAGLGSMSFRHHYDAGYHYLLFIDNEKNMDLPFDEAPDTYSDGRDGNLTAYLVDDSNGEMQKETILDMRDAKGVRLYQFQPSKILKISETEFIFEAYKKQKEDVMVKISLKD